MTCLRGIMSTEPVAGRKHYRSLRTCWVSGSRVREPLRVRDRLCSRASTCCISGAGDGEDSGMDAAPCIGLGQTRNVHSTATILSNCLAIFSEKTPIFSAHGNQPARRCAGELAFLAVLLGWSISYESEGSNAPSEKQSCSLERSRRLENPALLKHEP